MNESLVTFPLVAKIDDIHGFMQQTWAGKPPADFLNPLYQPSEVWDSAVELSPDGSKHPVLSSYDNIALNWECRVHEALQNKALGQPQDYVTTCSFCLFFPEDQKGAASRSHLQQLLWFWGAGCGRLQL